MHNCSSDRREKPELKWEKPKSTSETKSENSLVVLTKTENKMLKNGKPANRNELQNRKTDLKNSRNQKSQCPARYIMTQKTRISNELTIAFNVGVHSLSERLRVYLRKIVFDLGNYVILVIRL